MLLYYNKIVLSNGLIRTSFKYLMLDQDDRTFIRLVKKKTKKRKKQIVKPYIFILFNKMLKIF